MKTPKAVVVSTRYEPVMAALDAFIAAELTTLKAKHANATGITQEGVVRLESLSWRIEEVKKNLARDLDRFMEKLQQVERI